MTFLNYALDTVKMDIFALYIEHHLYYMNDVCLNLNTLRTHKFLN